VLTFALPLERAAHASHDSPRSREATASSAPCAGIPTVLELLGVDPSGLGDDEVLNSHGERVGVLRVAPAGPSLE
jgi:hypothetical protein